MEIPQIKFTIQRVMLGTAFVAAAFAAFGGRYLESQIVCMVISAAMLTACCIANDDQLRSMFGIIIFTIIGYVIGSLLLSPINPAQLLDVDTGFAAVGCILGLFWSEWFYVYRGMRTSRKHGEP